MNSEPVKQCALYIRVSSAEQADEGYSIGAQTEKLELYCNARGWKVYDIYIDPGFTGANTKRPALQKMLKDIRKGGIDLVLVYKLDRFTRSQKDCINLLDDVLLPNNCDFVSINENFDTSTPYGRAMIGILSVFAQLERETIRERTVMGRIERAKEGLYSGNAVLPIGYDYVDGKLVINDYEAMQIREMFDMYISGSSTSKIFNTFKEKGYTTKNGEWSSNSVIRRLLDSRLYHGELKYKGEFYQGKHEPIISKETWEKAQEIKRLYHQNAKGNRKSPFSSRHLLTGLLFCGECGGRMHAKTRSSSLKPEYMCYSFSKQSKKYITDRNCRPTIWPCWELEEMVLEEIHNLTFKGIKSIQDKNDRYDNISTLKNKVNELDKKLVKLMDLYLNDSISKNVIEKKSKDIENEKEAINNQIEIAMAISKKMKPREIMQISKDIDIIMNSDDLESKKSALCLLIERIDVYNTGIQIKWTFE